MVYILDNWIDNSSGGRGGRDSDNWGGGRDSDKWGPRGGSRDTDGWNGRGNRMSSWRGNNNNRRRNDDWEGPNQKRWRRDDNSERDEQQNPWKQRGAMNEEEWHHNKQGGSQWAAGKKDEGNYSKFKNRDSNEERPRRPSKWADKESDDKVKEDRWDSSKSVGRTSSITSKDESNVEDSHQTSAPMDLESYEGESVDNIEQLHHGAPQKQETTSNVIKEFSERDEVGNDYQEKLQTYCESSKYVTEIYKQNEENIIQNVDEHHNNKRFDEYQSDCSTNLQRDVEVVQQNSDNQPTDEFVQQNMEEKQHDKYRKEPLIEFNSQREYEMSQNDGEFVEQDQQLKPVYNDNSGTSYENERPDYDHQTYGNEPSYESNSYEQQHLSNSFDPQVEESDVGRYTKEEKHGNFYFGEDCESSINKSIDLEQQNNEVSLTERTEIAQPGEVAEINTAESNQS